MSDPRGATAVQAASVASKGAKAGKLFITGTLDGTTTVAKVVFASVAAKVSYQTTGDLNCTVTTSLTGANPVSMTAASPTAIATVSDKNMTSVTFTRTSGSGTVVVAVTE